MANILNLDPQVQIRIINLAEQWSEAIMPKQELNPEAWFNKKTETFDKSFKAILETFLPEETGAPGKSASYM